MGTHTHMRAHTTHTVPEYRNYFCCCDETLTKSNVSEEKVYLTYNTRLQSMMWGNPNQDSDRKVSHIIFTVKSREKLMQLDSLLTLVSFYIGQNPAYIMLPSTMDWIYFYFSSYSRQPSIDTPIMIQIINNKVYHYECRAVASRSV